MRAVIDEAVPRGLVELLRHSGRDVSRFPSAWKGANNGRHLRLVEEAGFDCLFTCDKNFRHQQNLSGARLALIVLPDQQLERLRPSGSEIARASAHAVVGEAYVLTACDQPLGRR